MVLCTWRSLPSAQPSQLGRRTTASTETTSPGVRSVRGVRRPEEIAGLGLGSALPSTPGYVGIYQFVAVKVLVPFGFSKTDAIAYILLAQAMQYAVIGLWGAFGFLHYRGLKNQTRQPSTLV